MLITTENEFAIIGIVIVCIGIYFMLVNGRGVKS